MKTPTRPYLQVATGDTRQQDNLNFAKLLQDNHFSENTFAENGKISDMASRYPVFPDLHQNIIRSGPIIYDIIKDAPNAEDTIYSFTDFILNNFWILLDSLVKCDDQTLIVSLIGQSKRFISEGNFPIIFDLFFFTFQDTQQDGNFWRNYLTYLEKDTIANDLSKANKTNDHYYKWLERLKQFPKYDYMQVYDLIIKEREKRNEQSNTQKLKNVALNAIITDHTSIIHHLQIPYNISPMNKGDKLLKFLFKTGSVEDVLKLFKIATKNSSE